MKNRILIIFRRRCRRRRWHTLNCVGKFKSVFGLSHLVYIVRIESYHYRHIVCCRHSLKIKRHWVRLIFSSDYSSHTRGSSWCVYYLWEQKPITLNSSKINHLLIASSISLIYRSEFGSCVFCIHIHKSQLVGDRRKGNGKSCTYSQWHWANQQCFVSVSRWVFVILYEIHSTLENSIDRYIKKGDKLALLLDFDGTLSPLAPHPSLAEMEPDTEDALKSLAANSNVYLAIISGRSADDAHGKVKLDTITYAGNHGLEIVFRNKTRYQHDIGEETRRNYVKMVAELEKSVSVMVACYF